VYEGRRRSLSTYSSNARNGGARGSGLRIAVESAATTRSKLDLKVADEFSAIPERHYLRQRIKPDTRFFVGELFGQTDQSK
jgi:hypothetical protein